MSFLPVETRSVSYTHLPVAASAVSRSVTAAGSGPPGMGSPVAGIKAEGILAGEYVFALGLQLFQDGIDLVETGISAPDYETLTRLIEDYIS